MRSCLLRGGGLKAAAGAEVGRRTRVPDVNFMAGVEAVRLMGRIAGRDGGLWGALPYGGASLRVGC